MKVLETVLCHCKTVLLPKRVLLKPSFLILLLIKLVTSVMRMFIRESRVVRMNHECRKATQRNAYEQKKKQKELKRKERLIKELKEKV